MDIVYKASDPLDEFYRICDEQGEERRLEARRKIYEEKDFNCVYCLYHEKRSGCMYRECPLTPDSDAKIDIGGLPMIIKLPNLSFIYHPGGGFAFAVIAVSLIDKSVLSWYNLNITNRYSAEVPIWTIT